MGGWLMALDTELQTTVLKKIFLPLQDSWKNPRTDKKVKAWYEEPIDPGPSPQNGSARVWYKVLTDYEMMSPRFQPLMFIVTPVEKIKKTRKDRKKAHCLHGRFSFHVNSVNLMNMTSATEETCQTSDAFNLIRLCSTLAHKRKRKV